MEINELAKMVRKKKGYTQAEFAELIGWGKSTYIHFEQQRRINGRLPNPPLDRLQLLAEGLGGKLTITF
jgi:transcriptional regulator with XRE-family HTH domain